ncbi:MAG: IspD/TarI family cytidylyltransferase [Acutalibacteraceae bacterium]|jgi:2-C-methyl-D-erythritol 4-phosphate cytidylyltransferase
MVTAAIFAGGTGSRLGGPVPKQYLPLGGKPVIIRAAEKFIAHPEVDLVLVLCSADWLERTRQLFADEFGLNKRIVFIPGGADRNGTLHCALNYMEENGLTDPSAIILTHDAARPLVSSRIITENIAVARKYGACGTYIPAGDTIAQSEDGKVVSFVPPRSQMLQTQTPQSFNVQKLKTLLDSLTKKEQAALTDACMIFTLKGEPIHIVPGHVYNIKITYPLDLEAAEALWQAGAAEED